MTGCSDKTTPVSRPATSLIEKASSSLHLKDTSNWPETFGFGRHASPEQIAALDIDISPDGTGLPTGSGDVVTGKILYAAKCAACHGINGMEGPNDKLILPASEHDPSFGNDLSRVKTIGNYWPYATTVFDYIRRAMPYNAPGSLTDDEVYSLTAFLLYANKIIDSTAVMDSKTLPQVSMPAKHLFIEDDRRGGEEVR